MYWIVAICCTFVIMWFIYAEKIFRWIYILYSTLPRDIIGGFRFLKLNYTMYQWDQCEETIPKLFSKLANKHPTKVAFHFENESWTYQQMEDFSNKIANYFKENGYKKGETIALLLENRPEYVGIWLGLSKIGLITALINTNLVSDSLHYSITVANSKAVIYGSSYINAVNGIKEKLNTLKLYEYITSDTNITADGAVHLRKEMEKQSIVSPAESIGLTLRRDKVIYIYTSGTTGLPKAAVISHSRFMFTVLAIHDMVSLNEHDVYYDPLPLYHSAGGMIGVGQSIMFGITVVLRKKFSASNFWNDCKIHNCTVAHYIGETCRYILTAHRSGININHSVKKMIGNGLRPQIWKQFADTFGIDQIFEFYGSTEGNSNLINIDNKIGAVGFVPRYTFSFYPITLIRCDEETNEPIRNENGFCIQCKLGEVGILIGKINAKRSLNEFTGYADKNATNRKVLRNVLKNGDAYFNSGDMLVQDELGYYYFKDRTGDTFRWKGENVATNEVESVVSKVVGLKDLVVYGVKIPETEGRAGMLALVDQDKNLNRNVLAKELKAHLPSYAIPLFLRIMDSVPMTGTFKIKKNELQNEGFDIHTINDPLYFYDSKQSTYVPLQNVYHEIMRGNLKL